jgi:hypothetical protein
MSSVFRSKGARVHLTPYGWFRGAWGGRESKGGAIISFNPTFVAARHITKSGY